MRNKIKKWWYGDLLFCIMEKTRQGTLQWSKDGKVYHAQETNLKFRLKVYRGYADDSYNLEVTNLKGDFVVGWGMKSKRLYQIIRDIEQTPIKAEQDRTIKQYLEEHC